MSIPFDKHGPQTGMNHRFNPIHMMFFDGTLPETLQPPNAVGSADSVGTIGGIGIADDMVIMPLQCATQVDGLAHIFSDGRMWNGRDTSRVTTTGAAENGIEALKSDIVGRGILLDVARFKGQDSLADGYAITVDDLERTASQEDLEVKEGDCVLIRTGQLARKRADNWNRFDGGPRPGLSVNTAPWFHQKKAAIVAVDNYGVEVAPSELNGIVAPFHQLAISLMGLLLGEIFDLDELAADCERDRVYEFMFVAPVLPVSGGVGSPLNPLAIK